MLHLEIYYPRAIFEFLVKPDQQVFLRCKDSIEFDDFAVPINLCNITNSTVSIHIMIISTE